MPKQVRNGIVGMTAWTLTQTASDAFSVLMVFRC
jgi:hypothetical protein